MQSNKEIGKISYTTPFVIAKTLEFFIQDVVSNSAKVCQNDPKHNEKILPAHV